MCHLNFKEDWAKKSLAILFATLSTIVFLFLDFLDSLFCLVYGILDVLIEGKWSPCYCQKHKDFGGDAESELSDTLYARRNVFRDMGFRIPPRRWKESDENGGSSGSAEQKRNRWSDCSCNSCVAWMKSSDQKLHLSVAEPSGATNEGSNGKPVENVIFLHGFLCSSSFWTETIFPKFSKSVKGNYRMFAVDLLGFGKSPKPRNCLYTLKDHRESIERTVILPYQLNSFHLVAHSMGSIVALALAAKYSKSVKSIVLVAPPYLPSGAGASLGALNTLAKRSLWPPLLFGSSFMSWYEHLGRTVCLLICRNHKIWEWILRFITLNGNLSFKIIDLTKHTHHSAWHSMHNVVCAGAKVMDDFLETLTKAGVKINVFQGDQDQVVPLDCSNAMKMKFPDAEVEIIPKTDHETVIFSRQIEFTQELECIWLLSSTVDRRKRYSLKDDSTR